MALRQFVRNLHSSPSIENRWPSLFPRQTAGFALKFPGFGKVFVDFMKLKVAVGRLGFRAKAVGGFVIAVDQSGHNVVAFVEVFAPVGILSRRIEVILRCITCRAADKSSNGSSRDKSGRPGQYAG